MLADIKSYAIQINNNTGIEFSIFAENGDVVYGESKSFPVKIVKSGSVLVDKEKNVTIFNINFNINYTFYMWKINKRNIKISIW